MRLQVYGATKHTRAAGKLVHRNPASYQREARPAFGAARQIAVDVTGEPRLEPRLDLVGSLERADHFAPDNFNVVRKTRDAEHRIELRRESCVCVGRGGGAPDEVGRRL